MEKTIQPTVQGRLNIIVGQISKIITSIDKTNCADVLMQLKAVEKSIKSVSVTVLKNHFETCVTNDIKDKKEGTSHDFLSMLDRYL